MTPEALVALKGSIKKWEAIVAGTGIDQGAENCPLCTLFYDNYDNDWDMPYCAGCPVSAKTGKSCCDGSPYPRWVTLAWPLGQHFGSVTNAATKKLAKEELEFLKSLLPKEKDVKKKKTANRKKSTKRVAKTQKVHT